MTLRPFSFDYLAGVMDNIRPELPVPSNAAVRTPAAESAEYGAAIGNLIERFKAELPPEKQSALLRKFEHENIHDTQRIAQMVNEALTPALGNDVALMAPASQAAQHFVDTQKFLNESGRSTNLDPATQAIKRSQIENLVKGMGNASVEQKIAAARAQSNSYEDAAFAEQTVREITAPEQYALMNGMDMAQLPAATLAAVATVETASVQSQREQDWLSNLVKPDFAKLEELERNKFRTPVGPGPSVAMLEALRSSGNELLGDLPLQDLPKLPGSRGKGGPDFG